MNAQHVEVLPEEKEENKNGISSIAKETKKEEKEEKVDEEKNLISRKNYASNSREACFQTLGLFHVEIETKQKEKADMPCILTTVHPNKDAKPVELEFEFTQNTKDKNVKTKVKSENSKEFVVERCIEINGTSTSESLSQKDQIEIKQKNNKTSQKNEKEKPSYNRDSNLLNSELLNDSYNQEQNPVYEMYFSDKGSKRYSHHTEKYPNDYQDKYLRNGQNNQQNYYDYPEPVQYDYNEPDYYGEDQPNHNQINYSENSNYDNANYNQAYDNDVNYNRAKYNDADYNDANYNDANYNDANYNDANYNDANYNDANYNDANYNDANYNDANYNDAYYNDANYNGADYNNTNYNDANYNDANYDDANYNDANYDDANYNDANYNDANYNDATYNDANYNDATYNDANYNDATYNDANYNDATYNDANYNDANYNDANYNDANYNDANYNDANYNDANYDDANYNAAIYNDSSYHEANYNDANYDDANYNDANYDDANYDDANYDDANYDDANYNDANYNDANYDTNKYRCDTHNNVKYNESEYKKNKYNYNHNNHPIQIKGDKKNADRNMVKKKINNQYDYVYKYPQNNRVENLDHRQNNDVYPDLDTENYLNQGGKRVAENLPSKEDKYYYSKASSYLKELPVPYYSDKESEISSENVNNFKNHNEKSTNNNFDYGKTQREQQLTQPSYKELCHTHNNDEIKPKQFTNLYNKTETNTSKYKKNCYIDKKQFRQYKSSLIPYHIVDLPKKSYVNVQQPAYKLDIVNKTDRPWVYMEQRSISYENPQKYFPHKQNDVCPLIESEYSNSSNNNDAPPNHEKNSNNHSATYSDKQTVDHSVNYDTREQINTNISPENSFYSHGKSDHTENNISLNLPYYSEDNNSQNFAGTTETLSINENSHKSTTCIPKKERSNSDSAKENTHQISSQNSNSIKRPYNFSEIDITRESINNNQHTKYSHKKNIQLGSNFLGDLQSKIEIKNTNLMIPPLRPLFM
ncbi:probable cyclin-dependent serine/threonine-protein kinase DDB_G0292550 [Danaus plexippus]|uniref:probable cyclin-dependent serine/threonine-protein kinase DDB_G0292550 n=1 Tax=Danaus plexippus TaxID=13037 RepID=UPI002AB1D81E|nr:probable cyclin-dependent serine/threonine-protein kinase DDB_G0292550 [Danaus plexippus]